ncbi:hypothetical protein FisN_19Hh323 [Fistulifera solaris]|jgi:hypothetical protein|uniref:DUF6816 domain-containing protein n=1 Tax=Fistulifera solaris TaxID=1519565 RepID=A0A1Z5K0C1_FISSO|nr:hypothetical protein FisN_19Hh323 [Fistulifera solaris]|eukprot:GAX19735.1 hypothetical protein FisN_19Hh323 [Fistulifera solaris]
MKAISVATSFVALYYPVASLFLNAQLSRRGVLERAVTTSGIVWTTTFSHDAAANAIDELTLSSRFESNILFQPSVTALNGESNGVDNTYYPSWLEGTWNVTQTLINVDAPLGFSFAGGPSGVESIGKQSIQESTKQLNIPVQLTLRYVKTPWGVAEDRLFNTAQRLNAFAGRVVVASVDYANVAVSNRASVLAKGGTEETPLQTTVVRFKGPAAQKSFLVSHNQPPDDDLSDSWCGFEVQRSIFSLTNTNTAPPITTDTEYLWSLRLDKRSNSVTGKLRIAGYLNPTDRLYFDAKKRAVTLQDYTLYMRKID